MHRKEGGASLISILLINQPKEGQTMASFPSQAYPPYNSRRTFYKALTFEHTQSLPWNFRDPVLRTEHYK